MKKYLPHIDVITLGASTLGILLRFWFLATGVDDKALYPANHISWILLLILSFAVLAILFLLAGYAGKNRFYTPNFPVSTTGAAGFGIGCVGMLIAAVRSYMTKGITLYQVAGVVGFLAAAALLLGAWCRLKGKKPHFIVFMLPCAYLCLRLFCMGHAWGDEPELSRFILSFFAVAACILASYQLWAFSVDLGNRSVSLLGSLLAVYLCLVSVPGSNDSVFYLAMAIWLFTNLCPKRTPPRRAAQAAPPAEPSVSQEEPAQILPSSEILDAQQTDASRDTSNLEIDTIIAEILANTPQEKE